MNREAERKRLVELLKSGQPPFNLLCEFWIDKLADKILADGWMRPPCKVGEKVYLVGEITRQIVSAEVVALSTSANDFYLVLENGTWVSCNQQLGKTVFLTREDAEAKLKEGGEG